MIFTSCQKDNSQKLNDEIENKTDPSVIKSDPGVTCRWEITNFHRPERDCDKGFWVCGEFIGCEGEDMNNQNPSVSTKILNNTQIEITFLKDLSVLGVALEDRGSFFAEAGEDIVISGEDAENVGYDGIVIEAGNYPVYENSEGLSYVTVNYHRL